jgi:glycosyltransferase involved in cell wall biosynthesis
MSGVPESLRIAHVDTGGTLRGGQEVLLMIARGMAALGHQQLVVCRAGSPLEHQARQAGYSTLGLSSGTVRNILALRRQLARGRYQIVHSYDGRANTLAFLASAGLPLRRIASRLVAFRPRHPFLHRLQYTYTCHGVFALSQAVRRVLISSGVPDARIEVIPAGVQAPAVLPGADLRARMRTRWGFTDCDFVIGHVAAFTSEKGQDVALDALRLVSAKLPSARLLLAGDGPLRQARAIQDRLALLDGRALAPGYYDDLTEFHAGLDLYIMPSLSEAWGLSALRAMAHGLPVIASDTGGLAEMIEAGRSGWLVAPGSAEALAAAILEAAADVPRRAAMGARARVRAALFSPRETIVRTESLYRRILGEDA